MITFIRNLIPQFVVFTFLSGCQSSPVTFDVIGIKQIGDGTRYKISIAIDNENLKIISENQYYTSIYVYKCTNPKDYYPASPVLNDGIDMSDFDQIENEIDEMPDQEKHQIVVTVPAKFIGDKRVDICLKFNGGNYFGRKLNSNIARLTTLGVVELRGQNTN